MIGIGRPAVLFSRSLIKATFPAQFPHDQRRFFSMEVVIPTVPLPNGDKFSFLFPPLPLHWTSMSNPSQPNIKLVNAPDYRETYANSVQVRVNVWDFFLVFGTLQQQSETQVEVKNFQGIYLSPQQAKALMSILQQNVSGYESTFGEIKLDPRMATAGPVH
jgi:flagellar protein FlaG